MKNIWRWTINITFFIFSFILAIIFAEWMVQSFFPQRLTFQRENRYMTVENFIDWTGRNRTSEYDVQLHFNRQGIRGDEISYKKPPGIIRVMFLGDSFVESAQVDLKDHFYMGVQRMMDQLFSEKIQIINYGVSGFENIQELIYFKNEGYKYSPDFLYLFIYPFNDVVGNYTRYYSENLRQFEKQENLDLLYRAKEKTPRLLRVKEYLLTHSHLFTLLKISLQTTDVKKHLEGLQRRLHMINIQKREDFGTPINSPEKMEKAWALFRRLITELRQECLKRGVILRAVMIPYDQIGSKRYIKRYQKVIGGSLGSGGYEKAKHILAEEQIGLVDLALAFEAAKDRNLYFEIDGHWTPAGHRLVEKIISSDLREQIIARLNPSQLNKQGELKTERKY